MQFYGRNKCTTIYLPVKIFMGTFTRHLWIPIAYRKKSSKHKVWHSRQPLPPDASSKHLASLISLPFSPCGITSVEYIGWNSKYNSLGLEYWPYARSTQIIPVHQNLTQAWAPYGGPTVSISHSSSKCIKTNDPFSDSPTTRAPFSLELFPFVVVMSQFLSFRWRALKSCR